ncbi:MAG: SIR2 family protein, partial [Vicinamibacterales bacterium]
SQPVVFLTGAGASKWLGKATTFDIYDSPEFDRRARQRPFSILKALRESMLEANAAKPIDFERLLDEVRQLNCMYDRLTTAPEYEPMTRSGSDARRFYEDAYEEALDFIVDYYGSVDSEKSAALYGPLFLCIQRIFERYPGKRLIPLFTLNYDEAIESAADQLPDFNLVDGFRVGYRPTWTPDVFEQVPSQLESDPVPVMLFKLHGSASWTRATGSDRIERTIDVPRRREGKDHVVLYPTTAKKAIAIEPFATAYRYFREALKAAQLGVFIGTSFRDAEINEAIRERVGRGKQFYILAVGPHADSSDIASRIGIPKKNVLTENLAFEPDSVDSLIERASDCLMLARGG